MKFQMFKGAGYIVYFDVMTGKRYTKKKEQSTRKDNLVFKHHKSFSTEAIVESILNRS